jgi:hypothetical protein
LRRLLEDTWRGVHRIGLITEDAEIDELDALVAQVKENLREIGDVHGYKLGEHPTSRSAGNGGRKD